MTAAACRRPTPPPPPTITWLAAATAAHARAVGLASARARGGRGGAGGASQPPAWHRRILWCAARCGWRGGSEEGGTALFARGDGGEGRHA